MRVFTVALVSVAFCIACQPTGASGAEASSDLLERYTGMLDQLRTELTAKIPQNDRRPHEADAGGGRRQRQTRGRGYGPAQYGQAMKIYTDIQKASKKACHRCLAAAGARHQSGTRGAD